MKEGLDKAGLKAHLAFQPLGYFCPDGGNCGYTDLAEWPFGKNRTTTRGFSFTLFINFPTLRGGRFPTGL